jgi:CRP/FNR family transcriptional regulator, cyclic AMP receptor protein
VETLDRYLAELPFLQGMSEKHLHLITGCASNAKFDAGQYIDKEGESANVFYVIRHGKVAIEVFNPASGPICIQTAGEGDVIGWSWLFPPYVHHFDTKAVDLTRAIGFDAVCLRKKIDEDHELGYELYKRFSQVMEQRIENTRMQILDLYK